MSDRPPIYLLTDNGSLRPDATFSLRRLAAQLSEETGETVHPVSLLHSHKIAPDKLDGTPADTFERFILARRESFGDSTFRVVPLFFGPSAAIVEYLPQRVVALRHEQAWPELEVSVAPSLVDVGSPSDTRIARILAEIATRCAELDGLRRPALALCDHGAPRRAVTAVRDHLASQLATLVADRFSTIAPCSMERREGDAYSFNEPLLENLLGSSGFDGDVVVSLLFFQPGRHAGAGGDVAQICARAERAHPGLKSHMTDLVGTHPCLVPLLAERLRSLSPVAR
ncbi:hypothetical protein BH23VER1_BH23VER1_21270 [soil metagenome]